ncbi:MAG: AlpA family phage regulatory protein [Alphaproteobacteria bacterium]|nr:MAG: AlpA family phage regulatory protein [Alphaproteobacteria bacterium]
MSNEIDRLLRIGDVLRLTSLSRSRVYELRARGDFPAPVRVSSRGVRWRQSDVVAWIESRPSAGADPEEAV